MGMNVFNALEARSGFLELDVDVNKASLILDRAVNLLMGKSVKQFQTLSGKIVSVYVKKDLLK